jgi:hypothetical protein
VYGDFMGVPLEGEEQEVLLKFSSQAQQTGGYVSLLGLIMVPFLWGLTAKLRRFECGKA